MRAREPLPDPDPLVREEVRMALHEEITIESIIGSRFTGRAVETTTVGEHAAVIPEVGGRGFLSGFGQFVLDPEDEVGAGFLVR